MFQIVGIFLQFSSSHISLIVETFLQFGSIHVKISLLSNRRIFLLFSSIHIFQIVGISLQCGPKLQNIKIFSLFKS